MTTKHTAKKFDEDLAFLRSSIQKMGVKANDQFDLAIEALVTRDDDLARQVIERDKEVNSIRSEIDSIAVRLLATRQPVASDLRVIVSALKIGTDMERVSDYAVNIAGHICDMVMHPSRAELSHSTEKLLAMGGIIAEMLDGVQDAFENRDIQTACKVWHRDDEVDEHYTNILRSLREEMASDVSHAEDGSRLLFVSRCLERMGDHIVNIAEHIYYMVTGDEYKGDHICD
jgi:phosphate transport system protein